MATSQSFVLARNPYPTEDDRVRASVGMLTTGLRSLLASYPHSNRITDDTLVSYGLMHADPSRPEVVGAATFFAFGSVSVHGKSSSRPQAFRSDQADRVLLEDWRVAGNAPPGYEFGIGEAGLIKVVVVGLPSDFGSEVALELAQRYQQSDQALREAA